MRISKTLITGAVAAVAVAGSASAAIVVDGFSSGNVSLGGTTATFTNINATDVSTSASYLPVAGSANRRQMQAFASASAAGFGFGPTMTSRVDVTSGNAAIALNGGSYFGSSWSGVQMQASFNYGANDFSSGQSVDLSGMTSANIRGSGSLSVTSGAIPQVDIMMMLNSGSATRTWTVSSGAGAIGNVAFSLNSGFTAGGSGTFSYANVTSVRFAFSFSGTGAYASTQSGAGAFGYNVSQFNFVPAPGALALLGAAGLVGARRRR
jgi:hypothetical protein